MDRDEDVRVLRLVGDAAHCDPEAEQLGLLWLARTESAPWSKLVLWFDNPAAFGRFLVEALPALYGADEAPPDLVERVLPMLPALQEEGVTEALLQELAQLMGDAVELQWLGRFTDLCAADTEATQRVVEAFRLDQGQEGASPVDEDEADEFAQYLSGWFEA